MPRGWTDGDPAKGTPHRRVREKIGLLMADVTDDPRALALALLKVAETRPEAVLDALIWLHEASGLSAAWQKRRAHVSRVLEPLLPRGLPLLQLGAEGQVHLRGVPARVQGAERLVAALPAVPDGDAEYGPAVAPAEEGQADGTAADPVASGTPVGGTGAAGEDPHPVPLIV